MIRLRLQKAPKKKDFYALGCRKKSTSKDFDKSELRREKKHQIKLSLSFHFNHRNWIPTWLIHSRWFFSDKRCVNVFLIAMWERRRKSSVEKLIKPKLDGDVGDENWMCKMNLMKSRDSLVNLKKAAQRKPSVDLWGRDFLHVQVRLKILSLTFIAEWILNKELKRFRRWVVSSVHKAKLGNVQ